MPVLFKNIQRFLENPEKHQSLFISNIEVRFGRLEDFIEALKQNNSLKALTIEFSPFNRSCIKWLADALKCNNSLETLSIRYNSISGDELIEDLADALKINKSLKCFHLDCKIGKKGGECLSDVLNQNNSLKELRICFHQYFGRDTGIEALADALGSNSSLTKLRIDRSEIGDSGIKALVDVIEVNTSLLELCINRSQISDSGIEALTDALESNSSLAKFSIDCRSKIGDIDCRSKIGDPGIKIAVTPFPGSNKKIESPVIEFPVFKVYDYQGYHKFFENPNKKVINAFKSLFDDELNITNQEVHDTSVSGESAFSEGDGS